MIYLSDYFMGRDSAYADELTPELRSNAMTTVGRANSILVAFGADRRVTSGWRPAAVNAGTPGAAMNSKHMTCQAIDLSDPDGDLDEWCMAHPEVLEDIGFWQEHPASTKGWCHLQIIPPKSGNRVFFP